MEWKLYELLSLFRDKIPDHKQLGEGNNLVQPTAPEGRVHHAWEAWQEQGASITSSHRHAGSRVMKAGA